MGPDREGDRRDRRLAGGYTKVQFQPAAYRGKTLHDMAKLLITAAIVFCALLPNLAPAQTAADDAWRFQVILYGYFPSIGGSTTFPRTGSGIDVTVDANKLLKNLNGVF